LRDNLNTISAANQKEATPTVRFQANCKSLPERPCKQLGLLVATFPNAHFASFEVA
jgi:hypothetical protein